MGTAYLRTPESRASALHRSALQDVRDDQTVITNVFTGRPARGIINRLIRYFGPMSTFAPDFPRAADALAPIRAKAEKTASNDFSPLWCGQAAALCKEIPAGPLTKKLMDDVLRRIQELG